MGLRHGGDGGWVGVGVRFGVVRVRPCSFLVSSFPSGSPSPSSICAILFFSSLLSMHSPGPCLCCVSSVHLIYLSGLLCYGPSVPVLNHAIVPTAAAIASSQIIRRWTRHASLLSPLAFSSSHVSLSLPSLLAIDLPILPTCIAFSPRSPTPPSVSVRPVVPAPTPTPPASHHSSAFHFFFLSRPPVRHAYTLHRPTSKLLFPYACAHAHAHHKRMTLNLPASPPTYLPTYPLHVLVHSRIVTLSVS